MTREAQRNRKNAAEGDCEAFCSRQHPLLVGSLTLYTGDPDLARDLTQEALARACLHWARLVDMPAPGAWLHRVALNLANSVFTRRRLERRARDRLGLQATENILPEDALDLRRALGALPRRQRMALVLRYYADLSVQDAALAMGCAPGTVKALTHQAIQTLHGQLTLHESQEEDHIVG